MRVRFWCESTRDTKNVCDTVVAHFLLFPPDELPRAFPTKARSHFPITALGSFFVKASKDQMRGLIYPKSGSYPAIASCSERFHGGKGRVIFDTT